ncbi:uncharacterized protein LOC111381418 [Olea europaea var. sylvestris]|uniref:Uncharacterized protein n=1 Tax=Olea europaea subsp. europaea TaxID=158383 RepID=A0A8S0R618_OLEEU|nr:uncharacterized protein LOC111381418 [Olea europaea var. sylvestris]XP_022860966.1 uncharacterized protein LOC111381418 [Olea europaea var. sylvestris]XP_022860967.1 uncharacterized protein LOC111381418 [Olea europaea var. sylvestris]CAA2974726.1 Hypothetical predicted protein [Olea europaea subsp. europaea]
MTCSICGLHGHYKRYHDKKDVPNNNWFEGEIEPVEFPSSRDVTPTGKLAPIRRRKASSSHASTIVGNTTQSMDSRVEVQENVTLEDTAVDFQQLNESESSQLRAARVEAC